MSLKTIDEISEVLNLATDYIIFGSIGNLENNLLCIENIE